MAFPPAQTIAANVRAEAARQSVKQPEMARLLGLTQSSVSRRMHGVVPFTGEQLGLLANRFGCPVESFFEQVAA